MKKLKKVFMLQNFSFDCRARLKACLWAAAVSLLSCTVGAADDASGFDQSLTLEGITFHVSCLNEGSLNQLEIIPTGLEEDNSVIKREIDGTVTAAEVADLNSDGSPEIYVYATSAGSGSYGTLVAYSANNKKSLSEISLPPLEDDPDNFKGYMGHDEFARVVRVSCNTSWLPGKADGY